MAVDKYFVSSFETGAFTQCEQSNKGYTDGQLFEAYPSPLCIPQVIFFLPHLLLANQIVNLIRGTVFRSKQTATHSVSVFRTTPRPARRT